MSFHLAAHCIAIKQFISPVVGFDAEGAHFSRKEDGGKQGVQDDLFAMQIAAKVDKSRASMVNPIGCENQNVKIV